MSERKIVAVVGATGAQGGGLVRAICADTGGGFAARAITRDRASARAGELGSLPAEIVEADLDDAASLEAACDGVYGAFCRTDFRGAWLARPGGRPGRGGGRRREVGRGRHVIWCTLEDTRRWIPLDDVRMPTLSGKYKVLHFDARGESDATLAAAGVPTTYLLTSFYWDNLILFGMGPRRGEDGLLRLVLPMGHKKRPGIAAIDIGQCAYGILQEGPTWIGRRIGIAGEHLTGAERASSLGDVLGEAVVYEAPSPDAYRASGRRGAEGFGNMFQFVQECNEDVCRARDVILSRQLNRSLQDVRSWLSTNVAELAHGSSCDRWGSFPWKPAPPPPGSRRSPVTPPPPRARPAAAECAAR